MYIYVIAHTIHFSYYKQRFYLASVFIRFPDKYSSHCQHHIVQKLRPLAVIP